MNSRLRELLFPSHPVEQIARRLPSYINMVSLGYFYYWWTVGQYAKYAGELAAPMGWALLIAVSSWILALSFWIEWRPRRFLSVEFAYLVLAACLFFKVFVDWVGTFQLGPSG